MKDSRVQKNLAWLSRDKLRNSWIKEAIPVNEEVLLPFLITGLFKSKICIQSLMFGVLDSYDLSNDIADKIKNKSGIAVKKQQSWYKQMLLSLFDEPRGKTLGINMRDYLYLLTERMSVDFTINMYRNAIKLMPTTTMYSDCLLNEIDYLFENPEYRVRNNYKRIRKLFSNIKRDEAISSEAWEYCILVNYCLTGILEEDTSDCLYLDDITKDSYQKVVKEKDYGVLFDEQVI